MANSKDIIKLAILHLVVFGVTAEDRLRPPNCPILDCDISHCELGVVMVPYYGKFCFTCECIEDPCATLECIENYVCETQWPTFCETFQCLPEGVCVPRCSKECAFGYRLDCDRLPTCCCNDDPCENVECPRDYNCRARPGKDPNKPIATCIDGIAEPAKRCPPRCLHGVRLDCDGRLTCCCNKDPCENVICPRDYHCSSEPGNDPNIPKVTCTSGTAKSKCLNLECDISQCKLGAVIDPKTGCPTCDCIENPCAYIRCLENEDCVVQWPTFCETLQCPPKGVCVPRCPERCAFGYRLGCNGLPTCCCNKDPCENVQCPRDHECRTVPGKDPNIPMAECINSFTEFSGIN